MTAWLFYNIIYVMLLMATSSVLLKGCEGKRTVSSLPGLLIINKLVYVGVVMINPSGIATVCSGEQLEVHVP